MTLNEIVSQVTVDVPEAPLMTVREQIKRMARELCQDSEAWAVEGLVVVAAKSGYPQLLAPEGGEVLRILELYDGDRLMRPGQDFEQRRPDSIEILRKPQSDTLTGRLACRPETGADLPDTLLKDWGDTLANGARWRLLLMPQPWQNPELGSYYQAQYRIGSTDAKRLAILGHARGGNRVKARRFI